MKDVTGMLCDDHRKDKNIGITKQYTNPKYHNQYYIMQIAHIGEEKICRLDKQGQKCYDTVPFQTSIQFSPCPCLSRHKPCEFSRNTVSYPFFLEKKRKKKKNEKNKIQRRKTHSSKNGTTWRHVQRPDDKWGTNILLCRKKQFPG